MSSIFINKRIFTVMNVVVVGCLVFLYHTGIIEGVTLPIFLALVAGALALTAFKPLITFVLFVGVIPLEVIDFVPEFLNINLRPYQFFGAILIIVLIVQKIFNFSKEKFFQWNIYDTLISIFTLLAFASAFINNGAEILKQAVVVISFTIIYFVVRVFVKSKKDVLAVFPILISSGFIVGIYAIVQNILFSLDRFHMQLMSGRPNATLPEPDWLGMYMVFMIALSLSYLYYNTHHKHLWKFFDIALFIATSLFVVTLIITVARSAWIGAAAVVGVYGLILFLQKKYKLFAMHMVWITAVSALSIFVVAFFNLTTFELGNRVQSTGTGLQEITVSCWQQESVTALQEYSHIEDITELEAFDCRHINLEDIAAEEDRGAYVFKIYRKDPNVIARADVYKKTVDAIKEKPIFGHGWGSSGKILGSDESGTLLNASNIFLETAISTGLVGVSVLLIIFFVIIINSIYVLNNAEDLMIKSISIFALVGTVAVIMPNLFNAGLLLGFVWVFFGIIAILKKI